MLTFNLTWSLEVYPAGVELAPLVLLAFQYRPAHEISLQLSKFNESLEDINVDAFPSMSVYCMVHPLLLFDVEPDEFVEKAVAVLHPAVFGLQVSAVLETIVMLPF